MPSDIEELQAEIARLKAEKVRLEAIRDAKIESLSLKLGNIPAQFSAKHPIMSKMASWTGKNTYKAAKAVGKGLWTTGQYLAEQERKEEERRAKARKLAYG